MVLFSGTAPGLDDFYSIDATDCVELCHKLFPQCSRQNVPKRFRMWIEIPSEGTNETYWADAFLQNSSFGDFVVKQALKLGDEGTPLKVTIKGLHDSSPNTSPIVKTGTDPKTRAKFLPPSPHNKDLETALSNLTSSTAGISPVSSTTTPSTSRMTFEVGGAVNVVEPFTLIDIAEASEENSHLTLIPLFFAKKPKRHVAPNQQPADIVLVDLEKLEQHVESQIESGTSPLSICIKHVPCRNNKCKDFNLTSDVWIGSMLQHSRYFRLAFSAAGCAEACRTAQLKELKHEAPRLYDQLLFWVDDMQNFEEAHWRLQPSFGATDIAKLMSPYYFTEPQARYLGNFFVEGSTKTLKDTLDALAKTLDEICTKSDLVPLLQRTFKLQKDFQKNADYKEKKEAWMKEAKVVSKMPGHDE